MQYHKTSLSLGIRLSKQGGLLFCAVCLMLTGCKEKPVDESRTVVSGTVTFQGQPLPAGTISFDSSEAGIATSASINDGRYSTDRVPIGLNAVGVTTASIQFGNPAKYVAIPEKYTDSGTSGLGVEIQPGVNENVDFELKP